MKTPTLNKIQKCHKDSQNIGEFLEWLSMKGYTICEYVKKEDVYPRPIRLNREQLLAKYFGVNLERAEQERRKILDMVREQS